MRLITRADLDGLTSAILLQEVEPIDQVDFAHPKDVQDGKVAIDGNDILANLPYDARAALWFDHHASQADAAWNPEMRGNFEIAPSAARVIADHYKSERFARYADLLEATDKLDAALLSREDIVDPQGWILIGYTLDPRSGLGAFKDYFRLLMRLAREQGPDEILKHPEVSAHVGRLRAEDAAFREHLRTVSREDGAIVVTDFRGLRELPSGNRFIIYDLFPDAQVSIRIADGRNNEFTSIQVGNSILRRDSKTSIGDMLAAYGGGGHQGAGTVQVAPQDADRVIAEIIETLKRNG